MTPNNPTPRRLRDEATGELFVEGSRLAMVKPLRTIEKSLHSFRGVYKNCVINIERDIHDDYFYIQVYNDGGYLYDGWYDADGVNIDDAIDEAIKGAKL